jgi:hypothetical protein
MSKSTRPLAPLRFSRGVTKQQADAFADELVTASLESEASIDAFKASAVMKWPYGYLGDPRHDRYLEIEAEILRETFATLRPVIAAAFYAAAVPIIERQRNRQQKADRRAR